MAETTVSSPTLSTRITSGLSTFVLPPTSASPRWRARGRLSQAFAGQQRLVDRAPPVDHGAVGGHRLAGSHDHLVARRELRDTHDLLGAVAQPRRSGRKQPHQGFRRLTGALARAHLEITPRQEQEREHRDRVVVDVGPARRGRPQARQKSQRDGQRHRHVHAELAAPEVAPRGHEERLRRIEDDGRGQRGADPAEQCAHVLDV
ncbi:MAG: hypothetical protein MUF57_08370 [Gammaproteobacteria bacterium]|nr:hypothetical protein [Gammaproteobacteria bacterium]